MSTDRKKAFTLIEVLVTLAIILILAGALLTAGKYLRVRAERQLTASAIEVIGTALQQYYDQTEKFPPMIYNADELKAVLSATTVTVIPPGSQPTSLGESNLWWCSQSLFYFLDRVPQSKTVLSGLSNRMLTNKDKNGVGLQVQISSGGTTVTYDWVRFVDAWGTAIAYKYMTGDAFPVLVSAGPDETFDTKDDLKSQ
ncbi:MAG: type II secretion system protein [Planctomycetes bacterium]|nr:type II secretion system protein [Planctomycetota bacterium]